MIFEERKKYMYRATAIVVAAPTFLKSRKEKNLGSFDDEGVYI